MRKGRRGGGGWRGDVMAMEDDVRWTLYSFCKDDGA